MPQRLPERIEARLLRHWTAASPAEREGAKSVLRRWFGLPAGLPLPLLPDLRGSALLQGLAFDINEPLSDGSPGVLVQLQRRPWAGFFLPLDITADGQVGPRSTGGILDVFLGTGANQVLVRAGPGLGALLSEIERHLGASQALAYLGVTPPDDKARSRLVLVTKFRGESGAAVYVAACSWNGSADVESCGPLRRRFLVAAEGGRALAREASGTIMPAAKLSDRELSIGTILDAHFRPAERPDFYGHWPLLRMAPTALDDL